MTMLIQAKDIGKRYRRTHALENVNFEISKGQIVGLLGQNGAGKTTLLKILLGLTSYEGELSICGLQPRCERFELMQRMCFIADVAILPKWLKVKDALDFIEGVHPKFNREKALMFMQRTHVPLQAKVRHLSKGMIAQLHLSLVMAIDVDILVLDEPTLGLDILFRKAFYKSLLNDYFTAERTIIIATHQIEEIEGLLTDVMLLKQGKLLLKASIDDFMGSFVALTVHPDKAQAVRLFGPLHEEPLLGQVKFLFKDQDRQALIKWGSLSRPTLSDVFLAKMSGGAL